MCTQLITEHLIEACNNANHQSKETVLGSAKLTCACGTCHDSLAFDRLISPTEAKMDFPAHTSMMPLYALLASHLLKKRQHDLRMPTSDSYCQGAWCRAGPALQSHYARTEPMDLQNRLGSSCVSEMIRNNWSWLREL